MIKTSNPSKTRARRATGGAKWNNAVESRDEQYQLKKNAVIAEAARAFGRSGHQNVSLDEIAKALNVTKPALYYYFRSKQELIYECHELSMRIGDRVLQDAIASESTGYGRIAAFLRNFIITLTDELGAPGVLRDISAMTASDQRKIRERRHRFDLRLRHLVEEGIEDGTIAPCDAKLAVYWFMGPVVSLNEWFSAQGDLTGEQVADVFLSFLARALQQGHVGA